MSIGSISNHRFLYRASSLITVVVTLTLASTRLWADTGTLIRRSRPTQPHWSWINWVMALDPSPK